MAIAAIFPFHLHPQNTDAIATARSAAAFRVGLRRTHYLTMMFYNVYRPAFFYRLHYCSLYYL